MMRSRATVSRLHILTVDNYLTYANADFRRQLRAHELRNGQSGEGHCQAAAIMAESFPMNVPQPRRYHIRRDGENEKRN